MNSSKSCARLKRSGTYLLAAIWVVCCSTTLAQTSAITASTIHKETSSGLRASTPSQADAVEPNSTKQRLDEVAGSFTKDDAFMGAVLVAKGSHILLDKGYGKAVMEWNIPDSPDVKFRIGSMTKQSPRLSFSWSKKKASFPWTTLSENTCLTLRLHGTR